MGGYENIIWLAITFLVLLGGVVLYLFVNQWNFQRFDHKHLIDHEEQQNRLESRIKHLEKLISELKDFEHSKREELEYFVMAAKAEIADKVREAQDEIVGEVINQPDMLDRMLMNQALTRQSDAAMQQVPPRAKTPPRSHPALHSARQRQVAELLEQGFTHDEVAKSTGVSGQEIEMVASIIFDTRSA